MNAVMNQIKSIKGTTIVRIRFFISSPKCINTETIKKAFAKDKMMITPLISILLRSSGRFKAYIKSPSPNSTTVMISKIQKVFQIRFTLSLGGAW